VTPNRGMGPPVRRFLSNYFDLLFYYQLTFKCHVEFIQSITVVLGLNYSFEDFSICHLLAYSAH